MCRRFIAPLIVLGLAAACASSTESAVNELLEQVRLGDPAAAATHAESTELVESTEAVPLWISALETDESVPARQWAARLLGRIGDPQAVPALTAALDGPREVREAVAASLLQIDEKEAEAAFIATLPGASRDAQLLCLVELEKLRSVDAVPVIAEIARSADTLLADNAVAALGGIGAAAAAEPLASIAADSSLEDSVRKSAIANLGRIEGDEAMASLQELIATLEEQEAEELKDLAERTLQSR